MASSQDHQVTLSEITSDHTKGVWARLKGDEDFLNMDSAKIWQLVSVCVAELLGTAIVVGLGCSGLIKGMQGSEVTHLNSVITFAFSIALVISVFEHVSGGHVNPTISLSALIFGQLSLPRFVLYVVSQCLGACIGIETVKSISPGNCTASSFCVTLPNEDVGVINAMVAEAIITGILILVVDTGFDPRCKDKSGSLSVKVAIAVIALGLPGTKYSGGSFNPARSFGAALIAGNWTNHWVYWVGPMAGTIVASNIYLTFFTELRVVRREEIRPVKATQTKTESTEVEVYM